MRTGACSTVLYNMEATLSRRRPRVLIGATGSVATVKVPELATKVAAFAEVRVVFTESAKHFWDRAAVYDPQSWSAYQSVSSSINLLSDADEWSAWDAIGDPVIHIQMREWADLLLIAPLSANTLGKIASGLCDNLLTSVVRAWDVKKPVVVAPAMNTHMWDHPFTALHLRVLRETLGYSIVDPACKLLACGDTGKGALAPVPDLVAAVLEALRAVDSPAFTLEGSSTDST